MESGLDEVMRVSMCDGSSDLLRGDQRAYSRTRSLSPLLCLPPLPHERTQQEDSHLQARERAPPEPDGAGTLSSGFPVSRTEREQPLLFKPPSLRHKIIIIRGANTLCQAVFQSLYISLVIIPFYRWHRWKLRDLPKATQLFTGSGILR